MDCFNHKMSTCEWNSGLSSKQWTLYESLKKQLGEKE